MNFKEVRTEQYRKDASKETALQQLNSLLRDLPVNSFGESRHPRWPICFLVGAPRSGTTLIAQYLAASGCFGYISNFVARFWENPLLGREIEQVVLEPLTCPQADFSSTFGVTAGPKGCHEFGYFWERWFAFNRRATHKLTEEELATVDADGLRKEVYRLASTFDRPLFFKNLTCSFQTAFLAMLFPQAVFVVCQREPRYQSQSILAARQELLGNSKAWWSLRPRQFETLRATDPFRQVAGQIRYTLDVIDEGLTTIAPQQVVRVRYDRFCAAPAEVLAAICDRLAFPCPEKMLPAGLPTSFTAGDRIKTDTSTWERIDKACREFFPELEVPSVNSH